MEEDLNLPKSTILSLVKKCSTAGSTQTSKDLYPFLNVIAIDFIKTVSGRANEICAQEGKKTINTEHIFRAARDLQMNDLADLLQEWFDAHGSNMKKHVKLAPKHGDMTEEQLRAEQALLLFKAKSEHGEEVEAKIEQDETSYDQFVPTIVYKMAGGKFGQLGLYKIWNDSRFFGGVMVFTFAYALGIPWNYERHYRLNKFFGRDLAK